MNDQPIAGEHREDRGTATQQDSTRHAPSPPTRQPSTDTASPLARDEVEAQHDAAEERTSTPPLKEIKKKSTVDKAPEVDQPLNPKRTRHSQAD